LDVHKEIQRNGMHCACEKGWTGLRCATPYESCIYSGINDTGLTCYNGGKCLSGLADIYGNEQLYCDCSNASQTTINGNVTTYVGKYCDIPNAADDYNHTHETDACNHEKTIFCVNGGSCKNNYLASPDKPCNCGIRYDGPHCEFAMGTVPVCNLTCQNKGVCRLGIRTYRLHEDAYLADFFTNNVNYQYCDCPSPYYGVECESKTEMCGLYDCFNGGMCVINRTMGNTTANCDCTTANSQGNQYGGRFCQYPSSDLCDKTLTENGQLFCVNNGTCPADGSYKNCTCPEGFHGATCEFRDTENNNDKYQDCHLKCNNGGQCRNGAKDTDFLEKFGPSLAHINVSYNENFEHCVCPAGYIGLTCEYEVKTCKDKNTACFLGSHCVDEEGLPSTCDCEAGFNSINQMAGKYCQYQATSICTEDGRVDLSRNNFAFCVNHGKCKGNASIENGGHPGCICEAGWAGEHCEFLLSELVATATQAPQAAPNTGSSSGSGARGFGIFLLTVGCIFAAGGIVYALRIRRRRAAAIKNMLGHHDNIAPNTGISVYSSPYFSNSPGDVVVDLGPSTDLDGNELHNVEII